MFPSSIAKEDVRNLPLIRFEGDIHVVDSLDQLDDALDILEQEEVLGFDTETKPTFTKGAYNHTALIQFSTLREAFLFRINLIGVPGRLKRLMENDEILKIGISLKDDLKELNAKSPFQPDGFVDLNDLAKNLGITQIGMRSLTGIFLESRISKNQQTSNWEAAELSPAQQTYAATDAWVCLEMYWSLHGKGAI